MKNINLNDIFLRVLFVLCILIQVDVSVYGIGIKTILVAVSVLFFLAARLVIDQGFTDVKTAPVDIMVYVAGAFALAEMVYRLIVQLEEYGSYMTVLSFCLLYFAVRNYFLDIHADMIFFCSILNAVISILLLYHYIVDTGFVLPVAALLQEEGILPWLILALSINVLGFCVYDGKEIWYGANAVVDFFLLFIQGNAAAIVIAGSAFLQTALRYMPRRRTVRRLMQMFFVYAFLLCNMTLITNYTEFFSVEVSYDLELSVYMELVMACFGICFFHTWDKDSDENDDEDKVLVQFRGFFKKVSVIVFIILIATATAAAKGRTGILPDVFGRLVTLCLQGVDTQTGILEMTAALYGMPGVLMTGYFLYSVLDLLRKDRLVRTSRHRKLFRIVSWVFVVQALFLTQSAASMPIYIIFVTVMFNEHQAMNRDLMEQLNGYRERSLDDGDTTERVKGENADETDHSDSMLQ